MAEYIEREAFLKAEREQYCEDCSRRKNSKGKMVYAIGDAPCRACSIGDILDDVEGFPAADVVERKQGKWIENKEESEKHIEPIFICSACENMEAWGYIEKNTYNFCPHCGADMSEAEDEDDSN